MKLTKSEKKFIHDSCSYLIDYCDATMPHAIKKNRDVKLEIQKTTEIASKILEPNFSLEGEFGLFSIKGFVVNRLNLFLTIYEESMNKRGIKKLRKEAESIINKLSKI